MNKAKRSRTIIVIDDHETSIDFSIRSPGRREIKLTFVTPADFIFYLKRTIAAMENANKPKPNKSKLNGG